MTERVDGCQQMSKDLLILVLPGLIPHLGNPSVVIHTYAALTIERILFMKSAGKMLYVFSLSRQIL